MNSSDPPPRPNRPVYLDNQATTRCDPRVVSAMLPWFTEHYGNPHSVEHVMGTEAEAAVEDARGRVAALIGADAKELVFTSGATESNNIAIKGAARHALRSGNERRRIVTVATEHKCVLESVGDLAEEGFDPVFLPVRPDGLLDPDALREALTVPTLLVSVMAVNNEIGVIQDIPALAAIAKQAGALFHTDVAQAVGKIPLDADGSEGRSGLDQRPQDLWAEGGRSALRPPPATRASGAAVLRWRPGARPSVRHIARAAGRRAWRGMPLGPGGNEPRRRSGWPRCASGCWTVCAPSCPVLS